MYINTRVEGAISVFFKLKAMFYYSFCYSTDESEINERIYLKTIENNGDTIIWLLRYFKDYYAFAVVLNFGSFIHIINKCIYNYALL